MTHTPKEEELSNAIWIACNEAGGIRDMARDLLRDIDAGKEPDGQFPTVYREDRGKRMTLKVARNRLHHIEVRLSKLMQSIPT